MSFKFCCGEEEKRYNYEVCETRSSACIGCNGVSWDCLDCPYGEWGAYGLFDQQGKKLGSWEYEEMHDGLGIEYHLKEVLGEVKEVVTIKVPEKLWSFVKK